MKYILTISMSCILFSLNAQKHSLEKIWETDSIVAVPESVLMDANNNALYVSLIDGAPWEADGKGGIAKIDPNGKGYNAAWINGLNAPKGMGMFGNRLYVADMNTVVIADITSGKIEKKIIIDSALGLNDITVSEQGVVYVSDSKKGTIWKIENDKAELYMSDLNGINGLKSIGGELFIGAGKSFVKANTEKKITSIAKLPEGIDGIEPVGNGDFILTAWVGYVFYVSADGTVETLLDTHNEKRNTADIGYDAAKRIVYVPTFSAKTVVAYSLK